MKQINLRKLVKVNHIYFLIPLVIGITYWLSFYPGVMTYDSLYQWSQLSEFNFTDWHPAYHTIIMWMVTRLWNSPASISLFQILVFSLIISYGTKVFKEELKVSDYILIPTVFFISLHPINGMMMVTLWKDVLYSYSLLIITIMLLKLITTRGGYILKTWPFFGIVLANIWLFRFNGLIPAIVIPVVCFLCFINYRKYFFYAFILMFTFFLIIKVPVYNVFRVNRVDSQPVAMSLLHPIAAHMNAQTEMTQTEKEFLNKIHPIENWSYSCYDATVFFYTGINIENIKKYPIFTLRTFLRFTISKPHVTLSHYLCVSSFVWQFNQPDGVFLETIYFENSQDYHDWEKYKEDVVQQSQIPTIKYFIVDITDFLFNIDREKIFWRPAIYFSLLIIFTIILAWFRRNKLFLLLLIPILSQSFTIAFTTQLQALRYQYPIYIISMLLSPIFMYLLIKGASEKLKKQSKVDS